MLLQKPAIILMSGLDRNFTQHSCPPGATVVIFDLLGHVTKVSERFAPQSGSVAKFFVCLFSVSHLKNGSLFGLLISWSRQYFQMYCMLLPKFKKAHQTLCILLSDRCKVQKLVLYLRVDIPVHPRLTDS